MYLKKQLFIFLRKVSDFDHTEVARWKSLVFGSTMSINYQIMVCSEGILS